jgi:branched-chain amino acid transport system substrate-binding protein
MATHLGSSSSRFPRLARRIAPLGGMLGLLALALSVLAGCGGSSTGVQSGGTLVFGAPVSKTGSLSHEGTDTLNGYNLWAKTVNAKGGITIGGKSYQVAIKSYDDASDANKSKQLTTQLITSDKVNFLLGPYGTTATLADETVALQYKIPMVEGNGAATSIFSQNNSYLFGVLSTAPHYGQTMIDAAASITTNGPKTIAIINADDSFSADVAKAAVSYAPTKGFTVVKTISYKNGSTDLSSVVNQLATADSGHAPDFVLGSGHEAEAIAALKSAAQLGVKPKLWGFTVGPALPDFITTLGATANGVLGSSQWTPQVKYQGADMWGSAQAFEQAYKAEYNVEPSYQAAESAACGVAYQFALQNADSTDPQKVRDALAALDVTTFYGQIKFASDGSNQTKPMVTTQIQNGVLYTVYPSDVANGTIQYPGQS